MEASSTKPASQPTILLVDDDEEDRLLMRMALQSMEFSAPIREFESGIHLLDFLHQEIHPDQPETARPWIVILDKYMPGLNGFETLQRLKETPGWQRIPVVLFVNTQNQNEMQLCVDLGATVCINKPLHFEDIKELMLQVYQHWQESVAVRL